MMISSTLRRNIEAVGAGGAVHTPADNRISFSVRPENEWQLRKDQQKREVSRETIFHAGTDSPLWNASRAQVVANCWVMRQHWCSNGAMK